jgi:hypothetical protein
VKSHDAVFFSSNPKFKQELHSVHSHKKKIIDFKPWAAEALII